MGDSSYVFDGTAHAAELERLRTLERIFDPGTHRLLGAMGATTGARCLEVGAGAGSIATWLADTVGPTGHVLAVDVSARFLGTAARANLQVREGDIRTTRLEPASFDVVHARFVLIHLPQAMDALGAMLACLKPGGALVLEEPDFSSARAFTGSFEQRRGFGNVNRAIEAMFRQGRMDHGFGARLPGLVQARGLTDLVVENDAPIVRGGAPHATMMAMSTAQLREKYLATGLVSEEDLAGYASFAADPSCWATYHATIRAAGRKARTGS